MNDPNPPSYDECPPQMTGGLVYLQAQDGRWYAVRNTVTGEFMRWPSNAVLGLPETPIPPRDPLGMTYLGAGINLSPGNFGPVEVYGESRLAPVAKILDATNEPEADTPVIREAP